MFMMKSITNVFVFLTLIQYSYCYKPVVLLHGILFGSGQMGRVEEVIRKHQPGIQVYNCDLFSGWSSFESAWKQVKEFGEYLMKIGEKHPEGIDLIGYCQGGLIARAALQAFPQHNVRNFISIAAPQAGVNGTNYLRLIYPDFTNYLGLKFPDLEAETASEVFYSHAGQQTSVGNYWNDPHQRELYLKYNVFLPYVNNEIKSPNSTAFKNGLTKLNKMILIGGPNDGVITPWESSLFGTYNDSLNLWWESENYKTDRIGLRTLSDSGRLYTEGWRNVHHFGWISDISIIRNVIGKFFD